MLRDVGHSIVLLSSVRAGELLDSPATPRLDYARLSLVPHAAVDCGTGRGLHVPRQSTRYPGVTRGDVRRCGVFSCKGWAMSSPTNATKRSALKISGPCNGP